MYLRLVTGEHNAVELTFLQFLKRTFYLVLQLLTFKAVIECTFYCHTPIEYDDLKKRLESNVGVL